MLHSALKTWKNAATLIVTSNKTPPISVKNCCNETYNVLMLKRSSKSTFFPSAHVFPGGNIEESDASSKWLEIFRPFVSDTQKLYQQFVVHQNAKERSPMFLQATESTSDLPREISYRISAIRETFEETGILLAKRRHVNTITTLNQYGDVLDLKPNEIEYWRTRVSNDANEFLNMCIEKECAPDIWALHEWSNWLTPAHMFTKNSKRYDTMFFITCLKSAPVYSQQDSKEVTSMSWESPCVTLKAFHQKK
uniref:Nucleoside diphosphate-linked moiety X motif 19 n=1 Tax=Ciona savignyi TaxID=51511 RepID=H2YBQ7_CIOSA